MKIGIYSPYLDTAGGGEKYILTIAECLSDKNEVDVLLDKHLSEFNIDDLIKRNEKLHGLDLNKVRFISAPIGIGSKFLERYLFLKKYNWFFYNTDGSLFLSSAKNNIVHFQVPFENVVTKNLWGKKKLKSWKEAIFNSIFTKDFVEQRWHIKGEVIYPPVSIEKFKSLKKKKQIISVGRFAAHNKIKKHELIIEQFKKISKEKDLKGWSLHLAGGARDVDKDYVNELKDLAKGYDIFFHPEIDLDELVKLYGESAIYWHAMGYGETDPKKFEHFGITTVEAMASGCVPVVINKGGQSEIVENSESGFLWDDLDRWEEYTLKLIRDKKLLDKMSEKAEIRAKLFDKNHFEKAIKNLVYGN